MNRRLFLGAGTALFSSAFAEQSPQITNRVAIQGVCAWPKLAKLSDGTVLALIFNQPCHGRWEGDLECWGTTDGGNTWRLRGAVTAHEPGTVRMNCAAGLAKNGDVVVLCGGWSNAGPRGTVLDGVARTLPIWVCRSNDGGRTWKAVANFPTPPQTGFAAGKNYMPFGAIETAADGSLCAAVYLTSNTRAGDESGIRNGYFVRSRDDGRTWGEMVPLNPNASETSILHIGKGKWLAASREGQSGSKDLHVRLMISSDDGASWQRDMALTLPYQVNGNLIRLRNGRILLTFGNRNWGNYGVDARFSEDEGKSWGSPFRLAHCPYSDSGYPGTVELADGSAVTAYYSKVSRDFHYEMRVAIWNPNHFTRGGKPV